MARRSSRATPQLGPRTRIALLIGKEAYLRAAYTDQLRERLAAEGEVDTIRFDGNAATVADVLDECRSLGLLQQHKLVVVEQADALVKGDARPLLERYAAAPSDQATLVLRAETWHRGKLDKLVEACGAIVKCDAITEAQATRAAAERARKRHGAELSAEAAEALIALVGADLGRVAAEVDKLATAAGDGPITPELVRELVGATREEQVWSIQEVLLGGDPESALRRIRDLLAVSRAPATLVRFACTDLARKLHAASRGLEAGMPPGAISKTLRLWGPAGNRILDAARSVPPARLARLLAWAVEADVRGKTGQGDELRALEVLAIRTVRMLRP